MYSYIREAKSLLSKYIYCQTDPESNDQRRFRFLWTLWTHLLYIFELICTVVKLFLPLSSNYVDL